MKGAAIVALVALNAPAPAMAQDLGFTLKEIEELIALRDAKGRKRSEVRSLAEAKMRDISTAYR